MSVLEVSNISKAFYLKQARISSIKGLFSNLFSVHTSESNYPPFWALRDISFTVKQGEVLGIIGPNGAGKSTLLKLIAGVMRPTMGQIKANGQVISILELGLGFQPDLSGVDNIFFNAQLHGFTRRGIAELIEPILEFAELRAFAHQPLKNYSSGMQMRLAFSIATHIEGDILVFDEVFGVGDEGFRSKSYSKLEELIKKEKTIILVSHNLSEIATLCDSVLILDQGRIHDYGPAYTMVEKYAEKSYVNTVLSVISNSELEQIDNLESQSKNESQLIGNLSQNDDEIESIFPPTKRWRRDSVWHNEIIRPLNFEVIPVGIDSINSDFDIDNSLRFSFTFEISQDIDDLDIGIIIRRVGQAPAIIIHSGLDSKLNRSWDPGHHTIMVDFPGLMLNKGFWLIDLIVVTEFETSYVHFKDVAGFKLRSKKIECRYENIEIPSLLRPVLSWTRN